MIAVRTPRPVLRRVLRRPGRDAWLTLGTVAGFLVLSCLLYRGVVAHLATRMPRGQDGLLYGWYLEWTKVSLLHLHNPLYSTALNSPTGFNVTWNTWMPLLGVVCLPFVALFGPFAVVSVLFVLAPAAAATSLFLVLRRLIGGWWGPVLAALVFGFGPWTAGHSDHLNLLLLVLVPPMILIGHRALVSRSIGAVRAGVLLGLLVAAQFLLSEEVLVFVALAALVAVVSYGLTAPREVRLWIGPLAGVLGVAAGVALLICGVPIVYQLLGRGALNRGIPAGQSADLASLVRPGRLQLFHVGARLPAGRHFGANVAESTGYLGWPLLLLCLAIAVVLVVRRDRMGSWWLLTFGGILLLSAGTHVRVDGRVLVTGPWAVLARIPALASAQPVRLTVFTTMLAAVLVAYAVRQVPRRAAPAAIPVVVLALLPLFPASSGRSWPVPHAPAVLAGGRGPHIAAGSRLLVFPFPMLPDVRAMGWQADTGMRFSLAGGYSVFDRGRGRGAYRLPVPASLQPLLAALRQRPVLPALADARREWLASRYDYLVVLPPTGHSAPSGGAPLVGQLAPAVVRAAQAVTGDDPQYVDGLVFFGPPLS